MHKRLTKQNTISITAIAIAIIAVILSFTRSATADPTTGTCLPVSKGGTSCYDTSFYDKIYPIGSIYTSVDNTNPSTKFGGTWVGFGEGRTLVGYNSGNTLFNVAEKTGGTGDAVVPYHNHTITAISRDLTGSIWNFATEDNPLAITGNLITSHKDNTSYSRVPSTYASGVNDGFDIDANHSHTISYAGTANNATNANYQPYITVYFWKRTN